MTNQNFTYSNTGNLEKIAFFSGKALEKRATDVFFGLDYFPYGKILRSFTDGNGTERYLTTGHERDHETIANNTDGTGFDYRFARYSDSEIPKFNSIDPLAHQFPSWSPYSYVMGNPIMYTDPDGRSASPIYNTEGDLLGTDDQGLQGDALVLNESDFTQGMSHEDAVKKDLGTGMLNNQEAVDKFNTTQGGLSSRPDYDGVLTFAEATKWSNQGGGKPLYVDASKISLFPESVTSVRNAAQNNNGYIDYFKRGVANTGLVYGTLKTTLIDSRTGTVRLGGANGFLDRHDFANPVFKTINDYLSPGTPTNFNIYCAPCESKVSVK